MEASTRIAHLRRAAAPARARLAPAAIALALLALAACSPPPPVQPPEDDFEAIAATFDADTEGWTTAEADAPTWQAPGYLRVVDAGIGWQYAVAPAAFAGDWTGAETISFAVLSDPGPLVYPVRVTVSGVDHTLYVEFPLGELVPGDWATLTASLTAGEWRHFDGDDVAGPVATQAELDATLAEVVDLRIRLDTTDKFTGDEANGLDDVRVE